MRTVFSSVRISRTSSINASSFSASTAIIKGMLSPPYQITMEGQGVGPVGPGAHLGPVSKAVPPRDHVRGHAWRPSLQGARMV